MTKHVQVNSTRTMCCIRMWICYVYTVCLFTLVHLMFSTAGYSQTFWAFSRYSSLHDSILDSYISF